jgi:hypothetical protein
MSGQSFSLDGPGRNRARDDLARRHPLQNVARFSSTSPRQRASRRLLAAVVPMAARMVHSRPRHTRIGAHAPIVVHAHAIILTETDNQ